MADYADVCLQDLSPGCTSEPQRKPTIAVGIMGARRQWQILVLPRRLPPGSRLRLYQQLPWESWAHHVSDRFGCSPGASLQDPSSGWISEALSACSGDVSVPQKNPGVKEPHVGFPGRIIVACFVVFALLLSVVCCVCVLCVVGVFSIIVEYSVGAIPQTVLALNASV